MNSLLMKTSPWYTTGVGSMTKSANGPWVPVVPGTEVRTRTWWCNCSHSPPQPWCLNREPVLTWGSHCSQRRPSVHSQRQKSQSGLQISVLAWPETGKPEGRGALAENILEPDPQGSPIQPAGSLCSWPAVNSWEPFLHWWEVPLFTGMTGLERCSLGDKWEMERGSRRQCVWTCSRGVRQSDVHKLGVSALYVQSMCVSESESWLPGGLMCLLKGHLPPTQAWSVFVKHSFACGQKESVFHSVPTLWISSQFSSLNQLVSTFCEVSVS